VPVLSINAPSFCASREDWQLVKVARFMLDDDGRLRANHDLLDAVERRQRLGAIGRFMHAASA
jgi:hypothetical protein